MALDLQGTATIVTIIGALPAYFATHAFIERKLTVNSGFRSRQADALAAPRVGRLYIGMLEGSLRGLDALMGPLAWRFTASAFFFCLTLSFIYSSFFLLLGWGVLGGVADIGDTAFLPTWHQPWRGLTLAAVTAYVIGSYTLIRWTALRFGASAVSAARAVAGAGVVALASYGAEAIVVVVALYGAGVVAVALAEAGAVALAEAGAVPVIGAVAAAAAVAVAVALAVSLSSGLEGDATLLLFWGVLPLANALLDTGSWQVSRWLGEQLLRTVCGRAHAALKLLIGIGHAVLDLFLALVFLVLLAALLPLLVQASNDLVAADLGCEFIPLAGPDGYVCRVAKDPWGAGSWATLMLVSTLFPTVIHAVLALAAVFVAPLLHWQHAQDVAARLRAVPASYTGQDGLKNAFVSATLDDAATRIALTWVGATALVVLAFAYATDALGWLGDTLWPQLDLVLPWLTRALTAAAYGFDMRAAEACLGP